MSTVQIRVRVKMSGWTWGKIVVCVVITVGLIVCVIFIIDAMRPNSAKIKTLMVYENVADGQN